MQNKPSSSSRALLWRLFTLIMVALAIVIYAYGWNTTRISLDEVQDPVRQASVKRAMRELLSPDIFTRDHKQESFLIDFHIGCPAGEDLSSHFDTSGGAYLVMNPPCADTDEVVSIEGHNFPPNGIARIQLYREDSQNLPFKLVTGAAESEASGEMSGGTVSEESIFDIDNAGYFKVVAKVPKGRGLSGTVQQIEIQAVVPTGWPRFSETTKTVVNKMIETIFLALMATTLALPIAVALSFVAARNLMRQVTLPLGNVLFGFILLPVGAVLGYSAFGPIGHLGVRWGKDVWPGLIAGAVAIGAFSAVSPRLASLRLAGPAARVRGIATNVLLLIVIVFVVGVLGGIGIWLGDQLSGPLLGDLGNFVGTLGKLIDLVVAAIAALAGSVWLASLGAGLIAGPMRHLHGPLSNGLGALLGLVSGAILVGAMAYVGAQAVLLRLITPIIIAILGGQTTVLLYQRLVGDNKPNRDRTDSERMLHSLLFLIGAVLAFALTAYLNDLARAIVDERPPSSLTYNLGQFEVRRYIGRSAFIGAILGGMAGGLVGTQTSFPLGMTVYNTSRTILNTLRSIEPLIMGIVFVIWVGVGPFAGVLALTLHSIASLGKLYSEQVENIDAGPIEAIQSTGANRLQTIVYAVVPQIVPPYIAFTMYRWDINVRMSTIIGFVGGGGIGFLLQQQINLLRYNQAGVAVLAIAIVVSVLDYTSAWIRERIV